MAYEAPPPPKYNTLAYLVEEDQELDETEDGGPDEETHVASHIGQPVNQPLQ